jgi:hypothetical protein
LDKIGSNPGNRSIFAPMPTKTLTRRARRRQLITTQIMRTARRLHARERLLKARPEPLLGQRFAARPCVIHVARLGEAAIAWQPVEADYLGGDRYRIARLQGVEADARLEFQAGQTVRCKLASSADGPWLVATGPA